MRLQVIVPTSKSSKPYSRSAKCPRPSTSFFCRKSHAKGKGNNSSETVSILEHKHNEAKPTALPSQYPTLNCRSFWKAGSDDAFPAPCYTPDEKLESSEFERARVHPKFLHSNATSHTWAFGAIAELLDNAVDEICNGATFVKVDRVFNQKDNSPVLVIQDDGGGMDPEGIRRCMSLGFSSKKASKTIGQYGNGFKTSTMRLGADAIVFSCSNRNNVRTQSIGLLSYTYLMKTMKNDIIVPMVDFEIAEDQAMPLLYGTQGDWDDSLKVIIDWSPFTTKDELMKQFGDIGCHGTKVFVYNLWHDDDGLFELDFEDAHDIRLRDNNAKGASTSHRAEIIQSHISYTFHYSLRAYVSILYLREFANFRIILRGKPVEHLSLVSEMKFMKVVPYRPFVGKDESVAATIGFTKEAPILGTFGFNIYHKNRLILAFCKLLQEASCRGKCVIGVLEANFLEPAHDKQDFERSPIFHRLEVKLRQMILDYWKSHCHLIGYQSENAEIRAKQNQANQTPPVPKANRSSEPPSSQPCAIVSPSWQPQLADDRLHCGLDVVPTPVPSASGTEGFAPVPMLEDELPHADSEMISSPDSTMIEKIGKENVKLFMRCEEYRDRQKALKELVEKLEEELHETRMKNRRLAMEIELRKKQKITGN